MPDISKCANEACPDKDKCYRYTSQPNNYFQNYDDFAPDEKTGICDYFMPIYNDKDKISDK